MPDDDRSPSGLEVVDNASRFAQLREPWERLAESEPAPFCSHAWFSAWWAAFGGEGEAFAGEGKASSGEGLRLCVPVLWDGGELAGAYPLCVNEQERYRALANVHSPLFLPLARDRSALHEISAAAISHAAGQLAVEPLPEEALALTELELAARESGAHTLRSPRQVSPIVDATGDFADWRAGSRPRWGAPLERFRRKMLRENHAEIRVVAEPEDLETELRAGFAVEASGWKGQQGTAIVSSPATEQFYREVAHAAAGRGELRLSTIALDGEVAAFDLTLLRAGRLYLLKTGFDERHRRLAPGLVLRLSVIERCFELGLVAHELLGDDSEWKRKFATSSRSHVAVDLYGKDPRRLAVYAWRGAIRPPLARGWTGARGLARRTRSADSSP